MEFPEPNGWVLFDVNGPLIDSTTLSLEYDNLSIEVDTVGYGVNPPPTYPKMSFPTAEEFAWSRTAFRFPLRRAVTLSFEKSIL